MPSTVSEVFDRINSSIASNPSKVAGLNAVYAFDLGGEQPGKYHFTLKDGAADVGEGAPADPKVTLSMKSEDFVDLADGKLDPTMAFMSGKIKIKGDMGLAMKLQSVLR